MKMLILGINQPPAGHPVGGWLIPGVNRPPAA